MPATVGDWLESLQLSDHLTSFQAKGYHSIKQLKNVWELELNSVSLYGLICNAMEMHVMRVIQCHSIHGN